MQSATANHETAALPSAGGEGKNWLSTRITADRLLKKRFSYLGPNKTDCLDVCAVHLFKQSVFFFGSGYRQESSTDWTTTDWTTTVSILFFWVPGERNAPPPLFLPTFPTFNDLQAQRKTKKQDLQPKHVWIICFLYLVKLFQFVIPV